MSFSRVETSRGELRIHESLDDLSTDLVEYVSELSEASVKERGVFTIALSGGSLIGLLGKLCEAPYIKTIDWTKWHIFWVDERVVAKSHADSNYKLARDGLLTKFMTSSPLVLFLDADRNVIVHCLASYYKVTKQFL